MDFLITGGITAILPTIPNCHKMQDTLAIPITFNTTKTETHMEPLLGDRRPTILRNYNTIHQAAKLRHDLGAFESKVDVAAILDRKQNRNDSNCDPECHGVTGV